MTQNEKKVLSGALLLGDCDKLKDVRTIEDAIELLHSPQGREFCLQHAYPTLEQWRKLSGKKLGVHIDEKVALENVDVILVHSQAHIRFSEPKAYNVTLLHGSRAQIEAVGYSVVNVEGARADIIKDATAVVIENGVKLKASNITL